MWVRYFLYIWVYNSVLFYFIAHIVPSLGFTGDSVVKYEPANAGDTGDVGLSPGFGTSPGGGNNNPFHYSCLSNPGTKELDGL